MAWSVIYKSSLPTPILNGKIIQKVSDRKMIPSLLNITIEQVSQGLDDGTFTVTDLVRGYIRRIKEVNDTLHAVIQINPSAESAAVSLDKELKRYGRRGQVSGESRVYSPC